MGVDLTAMLRDDGRLCWLNYSSGHAMTAQQHDLINGLDSMELVRQADVQSLNYAANRGEEYFNIDAYELWIHGPARPWFTPDRQKLAAAAMRKIMVERLAADPIVITSRLALRRATMTRLPPWHGYGSRRGRQMTVVDSVDIEGTPIEELAVGTTILGKLLARGSRLAEIPEDLTIYDTLDLRGTDVAELPESLSVRVEINIAGTMVRRIPPHLTCHIRGTPRCGPPEDLRSEEVKRSPRRSADKRDYAPGCWSAWNTTGCYEPETGTIEHDIYEMMVALKRPPAETTRQLW